MLVISRGNGRRIMVIVDGIERPLVIVVRKRRGQPVLAFDGPREFRVLREEIYDRNHDALRVPTIAPGVYTPDEIAAAMNAGARFESKWKWCGDCFVREA